MMVERLRASLLLVCLLAKVPSLGAWISGSIRPSAARDKRLQYRQSSLSSAAPLYATIDEPLEKKAFSQQTPHSGRHFTPSHPAYRRRRRPNILGGRRRFMEGWYYRLTLPEEHGHASFVFVVSIEDPGNARSDLQLSCIQVIGPDDSYLVQADKDDTKFWAWKHQQGLGCAFELLPSSANDHDATITARTKQEFQQQVASGFQILPNHLMGRIRGHDGSRGGVLSGQGVSGSCDFDISVEPICGWGDSANASFIGEQKSTGGWLSKYAVFEPHWQVTLADARATGSVTWKNRTYSFVDAPFYAEKNWGAALPEKWYWTQCNSFNGFDQLSVTAGGGIRKIPFGRRESLGMVSIHYNGTFYEGTPWTGNMDWKVAPFGSWELRGFGNGRHPFEAIVTYKCDPGETPGLVFRAPTPGQGMVLFCRATFEAACTLTLWELVWDPARKSYIRKAGPPLIDNATSNHGGAEVGGGPWWDEWAGESKLKQPIRGLLRLPFRLANIQRKLRDRL